RQRARHRLVGVPDLDGLWANADPGRARDPSCARTGGVDVMQGFADVDALFDALVASRDADDEGGLSILEHSLQCGELPGSSHPDDVELQVAGLVHDLGWLERSPSGWTLRMDASHDVDGRALVEPVLGGR